MKKLIAASLVAVVAIGIWFFIKGHDGADQSDRQTAEGKSSNTSGSTSDRGAEWPKSKELNQNIAAKNVVHDLEKPDQPADAGVAQPEAQDERIGKVNPTMVEHPAPESLPPLDMMSTEEQIKMNKSIIMTPKEYEEAKKKVSNAEMFPDVTEQQKQVDKEVAEDIAKAKAAQEVQKK